MVVTFMCARGHSPAPFNNRAKSGKPEEETIAIESPNFLIIIVTIIIIAINHACIVQSYVCI